jgi:hypothetical protein
MLQKFPQVTVSLALYCWALSTRQAPIARCLGSWRAYMNLIGLIMLEID